MSDLCQASFLAVQGFYKPAYLVSRSGIENFFKCIGIAEGQAVLSLTSVFELISVVRGTPFLQTDAVAMKLFDSLKLEYKTLCEHVHTASVSKMAHTDVVGSFPRFDDQYATEVFAMLTRLSLAVTQLLILKHDRAFRTLHHNHYDLVCDALPAQFKRYINQ